MFFQPLLLTYLTSLRHVSRWSWMSFTQRHDPIPGVEHPSWVTMAALSCQLDESMSEDQRCLQCPTRRCDGDLVTAGWKMHEATWGDSPRPEKRKAVQMGDSKSGVGRRVNICVCNCMILLYYKFKYIYDHIYIYIYTWYMVYVSKCKHICEFSASLKQSLVSDASQRCCQRFRVESW